MGYLSHNLEGLGTPTNNSDMPKIGALGPSMKGRSAEEA